MAQKSGFFDSRLLDDGTYDRLYGSIDFATLFGMFFTNGVFVNPTTNLQVVAKNGLTVTVKAGRAFIDGYWYELTEDMDININVNTTSYTINTTIVCVLDRTNRVIEIKAKNNVVDTLPVNDGTIHELVLAVVKLGVGITGIKNADITDTRFNNNYCGVVKGIVEQIDTTNLFEQFTSAFNEWFETIKSSLDDDVAGNLLNLINDLETRINNMPTIRSGTNPPNNSTGENGDIYIQIMG